MINNHKKPMKDVSAAQIRRQLDTTGYAVADVVDRETYLAICDGLGSVTQTREIFLKPKETVEKYTGYSHLPEAVPFHTDHPLVDVVGLFCERPDESGGENLLLDTRDVLKELSPAEIDALKNARVQLPRSDDSLPIFSISDSGRLHTYWLPAIALSNLNQCDEECASAVRAFDRIVSDRTKTKQCLTIKLNGGQAIWFDNFVMLHGRDALESSSKRFLVRAFIQYRDDYTKPIEGGEL